jgi:hypothetical protein
MSDSEQCSNNVSPGAGRAHSEIPDGAKLCRCDDPTVRRIINKNQQKGYNLIKHQKEPKRKRRIKK